MHAHIHILVRTMISASISHACHLHALQLDDVQEKGNKWRQRRTFSETTDFFFLITLRCSVSQA
jgi:hypothetical protein